MIRAHGLFEPISHLEWLNVEPALVAKCLLGPSSVKTFNNVLALGSTSKVYHLMTNSAPFFRSLVHSLDPAHPFLEKEEGSLSFKQKFWDLRHCFWLKSETFLMSKRSIPFANKEGVELVSFHDGIHWSKLEKNAKSHTLLHSNEMNINPEWLFQRDLAASSEKYLAVYTRVDSRVHIYTAVEKAHLATYVREGEIHQLAINGDFLFVVETFPFDVCYLNVFNLELPQDQEPVTITLGRYLGTPPVCFGKEYCLFAKRNTLHAYALDQLREMRELEWGLPLTRESPIQGEEQRHLFPREDHFIEVIAKKGTFDIAKISIEGSSLQKVMIAKDFVFQGCQNQGYTGIYFHEDRVLLPRHFQRTTSISSFDITFGTESELINFSEDEYWLKFTFLSAAEKVYHLSKIMGERGMELQLRTLTFGKI